VGPFKALKFQMPSPDTETLYLKSVNGTVDQYRIYLKDLAAHSLVLPNADFDTGKPTRAGEYRLTDSAYAKLLDKLASANFAQMPDSVRQNILAFYADPAAVGSIKRKPEAWQKTLNDIQQLKSMSATEASTRPN